MNTNEPAQRPATPTAPATPVTATACTHQQAPAECNKAICDLNCRCDKRSCPDYNRNLMLAERSDAGLPMFLLEQPCPMVWPEGTPFAGRSYNEERYDPAIDRIRCRECPERASCRRILSPKIVTSPLVDEQGRYALDYSEFSGCTTLLAPNYLTFDLKQNDPRGTGLHRVQTIQFLLWDNRGCDKREACDIAIRYRLLVSDFDGDLSYDAQGRLAAADGRPVRWHVLFDTLRESYNGWQVFHLEQPVRIRYIRLHFVSSTDESRRCNIVRFGAYSKRLVGYPYYNYLPTLERSLEAPAALRDPAAAPEDAMPGAKGEAAKAKGKATADPATASSIAKFPEALQAKINEKRKEAEEAIVRSPYPELEVIKAELLKDFSTDLEIAIGELQQHDRHVYRVKHKIFRRTTDLLHNSARLKFISIGLTVIGVLLALGELLVEPLRRLLGA